MDHNISMAPPASVWQVLESHEPWGVVSKMRGKSRRCIMHDHSPFQNVTVSGWYGRSVYFSVWRSGLTRDQASALLLGYSIFIATDVIADRRFQEVQTILFKRISFWHGFYKLCCCAGSSFTREPHLGIERSIPDRRWRPNSGSRPFSRPNSKGIPFNLGTLHRRFTNERGNTKNRYFSLMDYLEGSVNNHLSCHNYWPILTVTGNHEEPRQYKDILYK